MRNLPTRADADISTRSGEQLITPEQFAEYVSNCVRESLEQLFEDIAGTGKYRYVKIRNIAGGYNPAFNVVFPNRAEFQISVNRAAWPEDGTSTQCADDDDRVDEEWVSWQTRETLEDLDNIFGDLDDHGEPDEEDEDEEDDDPRCTNCGNYRSEHALSNCDHFTTQPGGCQTYTASDLAQMSGEEKEYLFGRGSR